MTDTRLEYIQATGSQWFDTGFTPDGGTTVEVDWQPTDTNSNHCVFCARTQVSSTDTTALALFVITANSNYRFDHYGTSISVKPSSLLVRTTIETTTTGITVNGVSGTVPSQPSRSSPTHLFLLASNTNSTGTAFSNYARARLYSAKVYDNGTLVRDLIPMSRDGTAGLYDQVNGVFYSPQGGTVIAGPEYWQVTVQASSGVTVIPSATEIQNGGSVSFTVTPASGMQVTGFTVNGTAYSVPSTGGTVTVSNVTSDLVAVATATPLAQPVTSIAVFISLQPNPAVVNQTLLGQVEVRDVTAFWYSVPASAWTGTGPYQMDLVVDDTIVPGSDCIVYGDHEMSLPARVSEYNAILRASIPEAGRVRLRALSVKPTTDLGIRIINGVFPLMQSVSVPASAWSGDGPWTAQVQLSRSISSAAVGVTSDAGVVQAESQMAAGIHVSGVDGNTLTLRSMFERPTSDLVVGVLGI